MASTAAAPPSTPPRWLQIAREAAHSAGDWIERRLEIERDQLVLWIPVMLGGGIAGWFVLPDAAAWSGLILAGLGVAMLGLLAPIGGRFGRALLIMGLALALGCAMIWWRAVSVGAPVLGRPVIAEFEATVERIDPLAARDLVRLRLAPIGASRLPPHVRVNLVERDVPAGLGLGAEIRLRARLMPPPGAAVPGAFDYARVAWFDGIGATGRGFAPVTIVRPGEPAGSALRERLSRHIRERIDGAGGGIAASLATGDQGAIGEEDAEAMRRSGLAHLLSVSGLHITAVVGATMLIVLRTLALSPWLALRFRLPLVAAGAGALAAIFYTWLTGAEVPTIRSCVAALLVLAALALGREAVTLRLVAVGALVVLLLWPEAVAGASFQLSFAAVAAIVALHESARVRGWFMPRDEPWRRRFGRSFASLLLTGVVVELALMPIGLFHFHKAGLYGAMANIVAIPLTTFVIMPIEALALVLDPLGIAGPVWWLCARALDMLLWIARTTAAAPGAVAALPAMPRGAYGLMAAGGLWIILWKSGWRWWGSLPLAIGAGWALLTPAPDLIVTGDGRHLALRTSDGGLALLRERAGEYVRDMLAEGGGIDGELPVLDDVSGARCNADLCIVDVTRGGRQWRVLATRSVHFVDPLPLIRACRRADVAVSERRLPTGCRPRWVKLDRPALARSGGVTLSFAQARIRSVAASAGRHPWIDPPTIAPPREER